MVKTLNEDQDEGVVAGILGPSQSSSGARNRYKLLSYDFNAQQVFILIGRKEALQLIRLGRGHKSTDSAASSIALATLNELTASHGALLELIRGYTQLQPSACVELSMITSPVKTLTHVELRQYSPWQDFAVSGKHDGLHAVLVSFKGKGFLVYNTTFQAVQVSSASNKLLIVEGEAVGSSFYVYDCIVLEGRNITKQSYAMRLDAITNMRALRIEGFTVINSGKRFATDSKQLKSIIQGLVR